MTQVLWRTSKVEPTQPDSDWLVDFATTEPTLDKWTTEIEPEAVVSVELIEGLPARLVEMYADAAVRHAVAREDDPGVWVASVAGLEGAWAEGDSRESAVAALTEAVVGWVAVKRRVGATDIPVVNGLDLNPRVSE